MFLIQVELWHLIAFTVAFIGLGWLAFMSGVVTGKNDTARVLAEKINSIIDTSE